jgi:hypothetical protein
MVGMGVVGVGQVNDIGRMRFEQGAQRGGGGFEVLVEGPIGLAQKKQAMESEDPGGPASFGLTDRPGFSLGEMLQPKFSGGDEDGRNAVTSFDSQANGAATSEHLVIRVRGDHHYVGGTHFATAFS